MLKYLFFIFAFWILAGCAVTSTYNGGSGAYQDYEGYKAYTQRYTFSSNSPSSANYNSNYSNSNFDDVDNSSMNSARRGSNLDSKNDFTPSSPPPSSYTPPPSNIQLGDARDSEAIQRATMRPYQINGKWYYPQKVNLGDSYDGIASWYGPDFHSKKTSNGEIYNMNLHTAAHKTLPMNTIVKVVSKDTNRSTIVRINDRGPFVSGRIIDLSQAAAKDIDMIKTGTARVSIEVIGFGGVISKNMADNSTIIKDMVQSEELKAEFKTGEVDSSVEGGIFAIQIGAFRKEDGAILFRDSHIYDGYETKIKEGELNGEPLFRVFIDGFKSEDEARDFIKSKNLNGFLVRDLGLL